MKHAPRLFQCALCHTQCRVCSKCDRGQIYCNEVCAVFARKKSVKLAGMRYQKTFNGKRNHAARQARYRKRQNEIVTHQGSPPMPQHASNRYDIRNRSLCSRRSPISLLKILLKC